MTQDSPQRKQLIYLNRAVWTSVLGVLALGLLGPMIFTMYADFPCLVRVDPNQSCLSIREPGLHYSEDSSGEEIRATLEVFLNTWGAYVSGGGCFHGFSSGSQISVPTSLGEVRLETDHDTILVDGDPVAPGESLTRVRYLGWNPWIVTLLEVHNVGPVADCPSTQSPDQQPPTQRISGERIVVLGGFGTRHALGKGVIVLLALASLGIFLSGRTRAAD